MNIAFAAELIYRHISLFTSSGYIAYQVFYYFFSTHIYHLLDFRYFTEYNYIRSPLITIKATFNSVTAKQQPPKSRKRADFRGIYDDIYSVFLQKGIAIPSYAEARFKNSYLQKL